MLCPKCREEIADSSIYCKRCGTKLKNDEIETTNKSLNNKWVIIALVLLITGVSAFGAYKYVQAKELNNLIKSADQKLNEGNYGDAIQLYNKALSYKNNDKIKNKLSLAKIHKENQDIYSQGLELMDDKKYLKAIQRFRKVNKDTPEIYNNSQTKIKECRQNYINDNLKLAQESINNNEYNIANKYLDEIIKVDKDNVSVKELRSAIENKKQQQVK